MSGQAWTCIKKGVAVAFRICLFLIGWLLPAKTGQGAGLERDHRPGRRPQSWPHWRMAKWQTRSGAGVLCQMPGLRQAEHWPGSGSQLCAHTHLGQPASPMAWHWLCHTTCALVPMLLAISQAAQQVGVFFPHDSVYLSLF